ncbi:MAG: TonB family protein [Azoarcus sp.]|nr:TonB family protein [Azoarcus sp.]
MPFAVRGFLLALVVCLHVVGAAALSRLSVVSQHSEEPSILRASWIEGSSPPASPFLPPSPSTQAAEPPPAVRPAPPSARSGKAPGRRTRARVPEVLQPKPAAAQSALAPAAVDIAPAVPAASGDSVLNPNIDVSAATAAMADGVAGGRREEGRNEDYVGPDFNVSYFSNPEPEYPSLSLRLREQGLVKLRVHVTVEGRAGEVALHTSSGFERLDKAALDAVRRWKFRPARRAGTPVAGWVLVPVRFELHG